MIKNLIKAFIDTCKDPHLLSSRPHHGDNDNKHCILCGDYIMPLDWCGCDDPNDANYKGYSCPNCGNTRMKCTCDLQGLSDSEKEAILTVWDNGKFQVQLGEDTPTNINLDTVEFESLKMYSFIHGKLRVTIQEI